MQDKNWQNWTQTAPAVITANGGLGEYSISFSDYYYDNDTAAIILKNFEMQQPVNPVDDIFGVNIYYNGDWSKNYWKRLTFDCDGDKLENSKWTVRKDELRSWNEHAIKVKDGNLIITFSKVGEKLMCGGITTEGKFEQSHGLFEIRFKVDEISGMWYAFWLMDNNNNDAHINGSASDAAEIDIFEIVPHPNPENKWMGGDNYFKTVINYDSYAEGHPVYFSERAPDVNDDFYSKWHTVLFLWGKENYELYIDGKLQYVIAGKDAGGMCEGTNHIILSSECTGFGGILDETMMPASFTVDYVKVYSEK